jgi:hypothetical protein
MFAERFPNEPRPEDAGALVAAATLRSMLGRNMPLRPFSGAELHN